MQEYSPVLFSSGEFQVELCITPEQLDVALAARARFYEAADDVRVSPEGDQFDRQANAKVFVVKREGKILGTIRNLIQSSESSWLECQLSYYFPEGLVALGSSKTPFLEVSRLAEDTRLDRRTALCVQGMLFRAQVISTTAESVVYSTSLIPRHSRFYKKYMQMSPQLYGIKIYDVETTLVVGHAPTECTFSYSLPETLGINMHTCIARYKVLKQRILTSSNLGFLP